MLQAASLQAIDSSILQKLTRRLPNKAAGPDGISCDMLRHVPYPAADRLAQLLTEMEKTALRSPTGTTPVHQHCRAHP